MDDGAQRRTARVGIDVGGTFTDLVWADAASGETRAIKTLSTASPVEGILAAIEKGGFELADVESLVFGSTVAINALVEKKHAVVGTIGNEGFRDTLELRRIWREHLFGSFWERPESMVPRRLRREVRGRISVDGAELVPLDEDGLLREVGHLIERGVESVAISFLHSHVNDAHERRAREIIEASHPELTVSISSEESPELGEYERLSTTVVAAALKPLIARELDKLVTKLRAAGLRGSIHVMKSNGGVMSVEAARRKPHELVQSGPSGGVSAARRWGAEVGAPNIITLDVGGTTADVSLIRGGRATVARRLDLAWDVPVRVSLVDIRSVGAGGGSIAWVDAAGAPRLGPASAGSRPGPACFGQGGEHTTVTDAAVLAGWLNAGNFAGGELALDVERSHEAVERDGLRAAVHAETDAAAGAAILAIGANAIAEQIRALTVKHGEDPRDFALFVYGGAGGLFGADVAAALGIERVILPPNSSVLSAWGGLLADEEHDYARTMMRAASDMHPDQIMADIEAMLAQARLDFGGEDFAAEVSLDMRYDGQSHVLTVPIPLPVTVDALRAVPTLFEELHERRYGHSRPEDGIEVTGIRLHARRRLIAGDSNLIVPSTSSIPMGDVPTRPVHRHPGAVSPWPTIPRDAMKPGTALPGPAIVEDGSSTLVVSDEWLITVGDLGEINMTKAEIR